MNLTENTAMSLRAYLREVRATPSEIGKRERFAALLGTLFPNSREVGIYTQGGEKALKIQLATTSKTGRVDTLYGNALIEFEKDLKKTQSEAERQLREYVAGAWQKDEFSRRGLDAVATDGVSWRIYRPVLPEGLTLTPENIELELRRELILKEDSFGDFYRWLNIFLFRPQNLEPTSEAIGEDFGSTGHLFREGMATLRKAWANARLDSEARLAFDSWQQYLTFTYGKLKESDHAKPDRETGEEISELEELFLRHTYLVSVARLMVWAAISNGKSSEPLRQVAQEVFSGAYFESKRLANMAESDFFHWIRALKAERVLASVWERILDTLLTYDLKGIKEDVLKNVYQQLIDPKDRHDLGEYYTPDWLCERVVEEMLPREGYKSVLDPSCGSGSFLRASVAHYLKANVSGTDNDRLRSILANVKGIDIHPVAVTIARATYVLALGELLASARRPIQIPVYLADSLFLPREVEKDLYETLSGIEITFGPRTMRRNFVLPDMMVHKPDSFDDAIAACTLVAEDLAKGHNESIDTLQKYLFKAVPDLSNILQNDEIVRALWVYVTNLAELIRSRQNSIWSFVIRNSYRPSMLRGQFDIILGNPPWVAYRFVSDVSYQAEIKLRAIAQYAIAPKHTKLFTQMELATVFLAHSLSVFARPGGKLAFVMPRSVLNGDQHQNLIERKYRAKFKLTGYWDLRYVSPLFNVPSCVLFAEQSARIGSVKDVLPVLEWHGVLPGRDLPWERASSSLVSAKAKSRVIWLGNRPAMSTGKGANLQTKSSGYAKVFRQGASLVPRSLFFVTVRDLDAVVDPSKIYWAATDEVQAREAKAPYRDVRLKGSTEGKFIFSTALSKQLLPFHLLTPVPVLLPLEPHSAGWDLLDSKQLKRKGYRALGKWMETAEAIWKTKRGEKEQYSLSQWLDYSGKLTAQSNSHRHLVVYNHSGTNVAASYFDRASSSRQFIVDVKLYWAAFGNVQEAYYVSAILNADAVNHAIKPFQSLGLAGERDIHKKLLDLPIPIYDATIDIHVRIANLGRDAHQLAKSAIEAPTFPMNGSIARQRKYVRTAISELQEEIEILVAELLQLDQLH